MDQFNPCLDPGGAQQYRGNTKCCTSVVSSENTWAIEAVLNSIWEKII